MDTLTLQPRMDGIPAKLSPPCCPARSCGTPGFKAAPSGRRRRNRSPARFYTPFPRCRRKSPDAPSRIWTRPIPAPSPICGGRFNAAVFYTQESGPAACPPLFFPTNASSTATFRIFCAATTRNSTPPRKRCSPSILCGISRRRAAESCTCGNISSACLKRTGPAPESRRPLSAPPSRRPENG